MTADWSFDPLPASGALRPGDARRVGTLFGLEGFVQAVERTVWHGSSLRERPLSRP